MKPKQDDKPKKKYTRPGRLFLFSEFSLGKFNHQLGDTYSNCHITACRPDQVHLEAAHFAKTINNGGAFVYDLTGMDFVGVYKLPSTEGQWYPEKKKK